MFVMSMNFTSVSIVFLLDFRIVPDSVVLFVFLLDFRTVPTVW